MIRYEGPRLLRCIFVSHIMHLYSNLTILLYIITIYDNCNVQVQISYMMVFNKARKSPTPCINFQYLSFGNNCKVQISLYMTTSFG